MSKPFIGSTIELKHGIEMAGATVKVIKMRAPTVADTLAAEKMGGSDAEREVALFANLCELAPSDLHGMQIVDYKKLQEAWRGFFD